MKAGAWLAQLEKVDLASQDIEALLADSGSWRSCRRQ